jgi:hypothetical protein
MTKYFNTLINISIFNSGAFFIISGSFIIIMAHSTRRKVIYMYIYLYILLIYIYINILMLKL